MKWWVFFCARCYWIWKSEPWYGPVVVSDMGTIREDVPTFISAWLVFTQQLCSSLEDLTSSTAAASQLWRRRRRPRTCPVHYLCWYRWGARDPGSKGLKSLSTRGGGTITYDCYLSKSYRTTQSGSAYSGSTTVSVRLRLDYVLPKAQNIGHPT